MNITIREGKEEDLPQTLALIQELAEYEKAPQEVTNSLDMMREDGFGKNPIFKFFVAENEVGIIGIAIYFTAYSTWKGKTIYLEDLVVTEKYRRFGIGKKLFDAVARKAEKLGAKRFAWQVLEWNEPAIKFYQKAKANLDPEWINCRMNDKELHEYNWKQRV
ncbi:GNAT family N-acetyltransferase [Adhaeribacter sp. BT258]|uniref:GNAT family N-acetyltransferase n=1 Tax=Adhaeribacter terrigena TaxID=2793070 RepID=A0ABS1C6P3_9BACT|nr:GNAT family N-acetyltransferase [Adhaeribacter terrigena]MBK0404255.1 GNAT family N-acetyltransferase [Adhaeribacter terrigena]